ncbi:hypothetical protein ROHU_035130 [Labeo rohita]|uniref:Uncharacterized protein n=1 Tax=Labeo rohita TaxID=84645 RepID=A0A498LIB3_LABRO|nr:hypothetical protein ROHU_035130 [Labeo rohita]
MACPSCPQSMCPLCVGRPRNRKNSHHAAPAGDPDSPSSLNHASAVQRPEGLSFLPTEHVSSLRWTATKPEEQPSRGSSRYLLGLCGAMDCALDF